MAPLVTGAGKVSLLVRDALGVQRQIVSSYYVSSALLKPGLKDFTFEAGFERRAYGLRSFDYARPFAAASLRQGLSDWITVESRLELGAEVQDAGAGATVLWPAVGEFGAALAASHGPDGSGALMRASFSRLSPHWNLSLLYQRASRDFRQVGTDRDSQIREQLQASAGLSLKRFGDVGIAHTTFRLGGSPKTEVTSLNYGLTVFDRAYLNVFAFRSRTKCERSDTTIGLGLTLPLGRRGGAYIQADRRNTVTEIRSTPPTDRGWGYRATVDVGADARQAADLSYRNPGGDFTLQVANQKGGTDARFLASGGLVLAGGKALATRQLNGGFALVETPHSSSVRIYRENQLAGRTDDHGVAVITNLRPYDRNRINLAVSDLPIEASLETDVLQVTPRYFGGVKARFSISRQQAATLLVRLETGAPLEAGSPVSIDGGTPLYAGYDGEVFAPLHSRRSLA